jgi:hypothetical protein
MDENTLTAIERRRAYVLEWAQEPPIPWKAPMQQLVEADVLLLTAEVRRLQEIIARAEPAVLNYYLLTGGQFGTVLDDMRTVLDLPGEISEDERAATAGRYIADAGGPVQDG